MVKYDVSSQLGSPSLGYSSGGGIIDVIYSISSSLYTTLTNAKIVFVRFRGQLGDDNYDYLLGVYGVYLRIDDYEFDDNRAFRQVSYGISGSGSTPFFTLTTSSIELGFSSGTNSIKNQITTIDRDSIELIYWN